MKLDPKETIAGVPILNVRRMLVRAKSGFTTEYMRRELKLTRSGTRRLVTALADSGYIEKCDKRGWWRVGPKGARLANAIALRRISRAKAEQLVACLLDRAHQVNSDPYYLFRVKKIRAFGSYVRGALDLGDVDLVVEVERKESDLEKHRALEQQRIHDSITAGRRFRNIVDELFWPQVEVTKFLQSRHGHLRLHGTDDLIANAEAKLVLFDDPKERA